jgi:hypothetical protein
VSESNVIKLAQPGAFTDSLTEILRNGARALLTQAVEAEVAEFLAKHVGLQTETGQRRVVRHGHLPERETIRSKGCLSNKTALAMVFKLVEGAQKSWRRLDGHNQLPKLIQGVKFTDGIEVIGNSAAPQPQAAA